MSVRLRHDVRELLSGALAACKTASTAVADPRSRAARSQLARAFADLLAFLPAPRGCGCLGGLSPIPSRGVLEATWRRAGPRPSPPGRPSAHGRAGRRAAPGCRRMSTRSSVAEVPARSRSLWCWRTAFWRSDCTCSRNFMRSVCLLGGHLSPGRVLRRRVRGVLHIVGTGPGIEVFADANARGVTATARTCSRS